MKLFINMKPEEIPWEKTDPRYSAFWENEKEKVKNGIEIDGFYFTGWLYWHINHWKLTTDDINDPDNINSDITIITPELRDNELIINKALHKAEKERKGIPIMGLRQMGKTSFMASFGGRAGVIFKNSQNLLMGTNADDLNNITQNMDFGLLNCTPYFRIPRISRDWDSERVLLGVKSKVGDNMVHSTYVIRNTTGGKKTEKGAGVSNLKCNLWDEIGKDDFLSALTATKPAMLSANGWRTIPICSGTGGNVEKAKDAKALFFNPSSHNFLEYVQPDGRVTGLFMPGWLRQDCKYKTTLAEYLISEGELIHIPESSELWLIPILVSNKEKAVKKINKELDSYLKAGNTTEYNRWRAYYPLSVDDVFLTESNNNFPVESIKPYIEELNRKFQVEAVELYKSAEGKIKTRGSDKEIITKFPVDSVDDKDAPIAILERPIDDLPFGAYVAGLDPYNENESSDRVNSLGSLYIFKRVHDPLGDYQYSPVAWYVARPKTLKEFKENCLLLMEYYNAYTLIERSNTALIDWFIDKGKGHLLADGLDIAKEINPKSSTRAIKGLQPTAPNQRHGMDLIVEYTKEEFEVMTENDEIMEVLGFTRIKDPMLLTEMVNYRAKPSFSNGIHDGNFDRICAFYHALILAKHLDKYSPVISYKQEEDKYVGRNVILHSAIPIHKSSSPNKSKNTYLNYPFSPKR